MAELYRRNHNRDMRTCKFCGMQSLNWSEVAPNKFRLVEPNGAVHDCRQFHENKRNAPPHDTVERGSTLRRLNTWMQRHAAELDPFAREELEEIIDEAARR